MSKVTSNYQVTMPKKIADSYSIRPGDEIDWIAAGDAIRVIPRRRMALTDKDLHLRLFDQATERHRARAVAGTLTHHGDGGWRREDLYDRRSSD